VLDKGLFQWIVGEKFEVAKCTVADIWKHRQKITDAIASCESLAFSNQNRYIIRPPKFDLVDEAC